jgi:two-component sensor histidine kinase
LLIALAQHRIKNNIGAIRSIIRMRQSETTSEEARAELDIVGDRVEALRLVHGRVYAANCKDRLPLSSYVNQLLEGLLYVHREKPFGSTLTCPMSRRRATRRIPLGLILNEFAINSLKHVFGGMDEPVITVTGEDGENLFQQWRTVS